jgi:hypothetical protein
MAWQENKRLRQENATITAERDEARREADEYCRELRDHGGALGQFQREGE